MTLKEMHKDLLSRFYQKTTALLEAPESNMSDAEKQQMLREAANVFSFACEKLSGNDES